MALRNFIDRNISPHFHEGGKLERYYVFYEMFDTMLYSPSNTTRSTAHVRDGIDLKRVMITVWFAALPALFFGMYNAGYQANLQITEFGYDLPPTIPLWMVFLGISFGVVVGKEIFGGTGKNFLNPALVGRAFLFFAYPAQMSGDAVWTAVDDFSGATPLALAAAGELDYPDHHQLHHSGPCRGLRHEQPAVPVGGGRLRQCAGVFHRAAVRRRQS